MDIEKLDEWNRSLKLVVKDSTPAFMNALRRIAMKEVPVLAIENVLIDENDSALFDNIIAQRLGQIPLEFDPEKFEPKEECDCEGDCPNCEVRFSLEKEGPGVVYSGDLVPETEEINPLYDNIPITELDENQTVKLECVAILSTGKDHSKHQASITSYQYYPQIDIDQDKLTKKAARKAAEVCPTDVFDENNGELEIADERNCTLCKECVEEVDSEGLEVNEDDEKFILNVESISALEPKKILKIALSSLQEKADKTIEKLET